MKNILYVEKRNFVATSKNGIKVVSVIDKVEKYFAYEDIGIIIFDNKHSYFSENLIRKCAEYNIALLFCDVNHSPLILFESIYGQEKRLLLLQKQLELLNKVKSRLWKKIVVTKIENQARALERCTESKEQVELIRSVVTNVTEGDKRNAEAYAARVYFISLFGKNFKRGRYDDIINSSLNYGYAILRMLIRREIVIHGLEPSWGINHISTSNPFNLSDDLIEAYRPFVDWWVVTQVLPLADQNLGLTQEDKQALLKVLFEKCVIDEKVYALADAIGLTVDSYVHCLKLNSSGGLKLPTFIQGGS